MSTYWILTGLVGVAFLGLVSYPLIRRRRQGGAGQKVSGRGSAQVGATEHLVDLAGLRDYALLTEAGDLVVMLEMQPFVLTTGATPQAVGEMFARAIDAMPEGGTWQIVQLPGTQSVEAYTDRLAAFAHGWLGGLEQAQQDGKEDELRWAQRRMALPATLGVMLLEQAGLADLALRRTLIVLSQSAVACRRLPATAPEWQKPLDALQRQILDVTGGLRDAGFALRQLSVQEMIETLWHTYNPGAMRDGGLIAERQRRFAEILDQGQPLSLEKSLLTESEIVRAMQESLEDPAALKRLVAPSSWEELDDAIIINGNKATSTYYVDNFTYDRMPALARILGEFAGRLHVALYVHAPERAEVVQLARKSSVVRQASDMVRGAYGQVQDYKSAQEINATEDLRARAEMGLQTPRYLGLYLTLFASSKDALEEMRPKFESHLRNQGVRFICARWQQDAAFRSVIPFSTRHHRYEDRNLTPDNFAMLCPCTGATYFEPKGFLHGFLRPPPGTLTSEAPLVLDRLQGGNAPGASEALIGSPRSGKSVTLKNLALTWLAHGHKVIVIDPKMEYGGLAEWIGGEVVPLAGAGGSGFNLFHFEPMQGDDPRVQELAANTFADNLNALLTLYAFLKDSARPAVTGPERSILTRALRIAMEHKGMQSRDASTWKPDRLLLADVYAVLAQELRREDPTTVGLITATLREHATPSGQYYALYNTPRHMNLNADLTVIHFGLSGVQVAGFERALAQHFALRIAASQALRGFTQGRKLCPLHIILDEASQVLVDEHMVSTVVKMLSTLPAFGVTLHLAFQDAHALVKADRFGHTGGGGTQSVNTLMGVLGTYWLFYQSPSSAREIGERMELSRGEVAELSRLRVGEALLVLPDQEHIPVQVIVPPPWLPGFESDMHSMQRNLERAVGSEVLLEEVQ